MEISINTTLASHKVKVENYEDIVRLMIRIVKEFKNEDNDWEQLKRDEMMLEDDKYPEEVEEQ